MSKYFLRYPQGAIPKARQLRRSLTDAERKLWSLLRHNQLGVRFRRQVAFGPYILDFFSTRAKLVVELDGSQHYQTEILDKDMKRDNFLRKHGFAVLRFNNREFLKNPEVVLEIIHEHIQKSRSGI